MRLIQIIKPLVIFSLLMIMTPLSGQSYYSLTENEPIEESKIQWYIDDKGKVRYDLPKIIFQKLENKAKKLVKIEKILADEKKLTQQVVDANITLQTQLVELQKDIGKAKIEYDDLSDEFSLIKRDNNRLIDENEKINLRLNDVKETASRYKTERNWSIIGITVITLAAFLAK